MDSAEFEHHALALVRNGYSPLPIAPSQPPRSDGSKRPEGKAPGYRHPDGTWGLLPGWQRWCSEPMNEHRVRAWSRMIGPAHDAGIGVALGRSLVCVDIDDDDCMGAVQDALSPALVSKRGKKGLSLFVNRPFNCRMLSSLLAMSALGSWSFPRSLGAS